MSFGDKVREMRLKANFGLREASRLLEIAPSYLSEIEAGDQEPPSLKVIERMAKLYKTSLDELLQNSGKRSSQYTANLVSKTPELQALFRLTKEMGPEEIKEMIREVLNKKKELSEEEIDNYIKNLSRNSNLPRLHKSARDGLFAAQIKPRFMSKKQISAMAQRVLEEHGITESNYKAPTPIERIIEGTPKVLFRISRYLKMSALGQPFELGYSRWSDTNPGYREICISASIAEERRPTDEFRFRFTGAHELLHVIEHLPLMGTADRVLGKCAHTVVVDPHIKLEGDSLASHFVRAWVNNQKGPRKLESDEDWREWQANHFAACILMPPEALAREFHRYFGSKAVICEAGANARETAFRAATEIVTPTGVFAKPLHHLFNVSAQAMSIRLLDLGLVRGEA